MGAGLESIMFSILREGEMLPKAPSISKSLYLLKTFSHQSLFCTFQALHGHGQSSNQSTSLSFSHMRVINFWNMCLQCKMDSNLTFQESEAGENGFGNNDYEDMVDML